MPVVPEHSGHLKRQAGNITGSEEEGYEGKDEEHHHGVLGKGKKKANEDDAEIMMAIWSAIDRKQLGTISIHMCMDEAGRWRIAWGQLAD